MGTFVYLGNGRGVRPLFGGHYSLVFLSFVCPFAGLQRATVKLQIVGTASPYRKILFEAVFGKEFCTNE